MKRLYTFFALLIITSNAFAGTNVALLIGVGDYQNTNSNLDGPPADLASLADVLPSWGYSPKNITRLLDSDATKSNILYAIDKIERITKAGDSVFIYFSGHGTSAQDSDLGLPLPITTGAFIPYDYARNSDKNAIVESLIIGERDLQPRFKKLESKGRTVFVIVDACYSQNTARSVSGMFNSNNKYTIASRSFDLFDGMNVSNLKSTQTTIRKNFPYKNLVYMAASSKHETAGDYTENMTNQTYDGKPHGVFTNELLTVLTSRKNLDSDRDGVVSIREAFKQIRMGLENKSQTPQLMYNKQNANVIDSPLFDRGISISASENNNTQGNVNNLKLYINSKILKLRSEFRNNFNIELVSQDYDLAVHPVGDEAIVFRASGEEIGQYSLSDTSELLRMISSVAWMKQIRKINFNGEIQVSLHQDISHSKNIVKLGEEFSLIANIEEKGYFWLFTVGSSGNISLLYPETKSKFHRKKKAGNISAINKVEAYGTAGEDWFVAVSATNKIKDLKKYIQRGKFSSQSEDAHHLLEVLRENSEFLSVDLIMVKSIE